MPNLQHLIDNDPNALPDLPQPTVFEPKVRVRPGGGIRVAQSGDDILVSAKPEVAIGGGSGETVFIDPLAYVSFRVKRVTTDEGADAITIATSYVNNMYYEGGWYHEQYEIPSETILTPVLPQILYLKLPVVFYSAPSPNPIPPLYPSDTFNSDSQTVNGGGYIFTQSNTTAYITRNRFTSPSSYYVLSQVEIGPQVQITTGDSGDGEGFYYFLIANIGEEFINGVEQLHISTITLPQTFNFNIVDIEVAAA